MGIFFRGAIEKRLEEFKRKGVLQGGKNHPSPNSVSPDTNEAEIITDARGYINQEKNALLANLASIERHVNNYNNEINNLEASCKAAEGQHNLEGAFTALLASHRMELVSIQEEELSARADIDSFKHLHGIQRPAKYPEDSLHHFSLLVLFVAIETAINAFFYEAQSGGLLGGAVIALSVSVVNMGIAVFFGIFFRHVHLNDDKQKLIGYSSFVSFIALSIVLNLIFSTFRVQFGLIANPSDPLQLRNGFLVAVREAIGVFLFQFPSIDFMSFILFFVGMGCCVAGFYKGYTIDDPCPGYGEKERRFKKAKNTYATKREVLLHEVTGVLDQKIMEIEKLLTNVSDLQRKIAALKPEARNSHTNYGANIETIQNELELVLKAYRDSNSAVRTVPRPAYFADTVSVCPETDDPEKLSPIIRQIDEVSARANEMQAAYRKSLNEVKQQMSQTKYELLSHGVNTFFKEIEQEAGNNIASKTFRPQ